MQKDLATSLNSPILTVRTPIKRLGLSRKRKSTSVLSCETKIQILDKNSSNTPIKKTVDVNIYNKSNYFHTFLHSLYFYNIITD